MYSNSSSEARWTCRESSVRTISVMPSIVLEFENDVNYENI
jgi:hypothetical protein